MTYSAPTKPKTRKAKLQPRLDIGQPFVPGPKPVGHIDPQIAAMAKGLKVNPSIGMTDAQRQSEYQRQQSFGGGEQGAYQSGLDAFNRGEPVSEDWAKAYGKGGSPTSMARGGGVTIPEPASLIGDQSGKIYAKVGDRQDGKPEQFIVPNEGP